MTVSPPALLAAVDATAHIHLIIGSNPLAGARCARSLEVGAVPILLAPATAQLHYSLAKRIEEHAVQWIQRDFEESDLTTLGRAEIDQVVDAVFITSGGKTPRSAEIAALCRRKRIPVNVADAPNLCSFTLLSTYTSGPLQVGVTTSGRGCKLASRIRREIAAALPAELGAAVERLGGMRRKIWEQDHANNEANGMLSMEFDNEDDDVGQTAAFNKLVIPTDVEAARARRMRWLSQVCEYWPLRRLAAITDEDVAAILVAYRQEATTDRASTTSPSLTTEAKPILSANVLDARRSRGRIILAGSGPGHPDLLTTATLKALRHADLILADKLVPAAVLALAPRRTPIHIARKFPGNADAAQDELHTLGLEALQQGRSVLRLKQGDPYLYGRGAEEVAFFRSHGFEPIVLPGITSSLSAPLFAQIPPTHRAVADQLLICTGTGRKGAAPDPPAFRGQQTVVFLMALHRLQDLVTSLLECKNGQYPPSLACAVIERASCPDQRVIRTTLEHVVAAVEEEGSRPPGLLVVGSACEVLLTMDQREKMAQFRWVTEEGFRGLEGLDGWDEFLSGSEDAAIPASTGPVGGRGLDGLREALISPDAIEKPDPLSGAGVVLSSARMAAMVV